MKNVAIFIVACFAAIALSFAAAPARGKSPREAQLEALKKQFPAHLAGAVSDRSDPHVIMCYRKYKRLVDDLEVPSLPAQIVDLRDMLQSDISSAKADLSLGRKTLDDQAKRAIRQNISWLEQRVAPFINKISQFQRGK